MLYDDKDLFISDEEAEKADTNKVEPAKVVSFPEKGKLKKDIRVVKIPVEGDELPLEIDVADAYFMAQLIKLVKYARDVEKPLQEKLSEADKITDVLDRACAIADINLEFSRTLKDKVDDVFGDGTVAKYIGGRVPLVYRYAGFFDAVAPYINEYYNNEKELQNVIANEYNI